MHREQYKTRFQVEKKVKIYIAFKFMKINIYCKVFLNRIVRWKKLVA